MTPKEKAEELVEIYKKEVSITIKDYSLVCKVLDIDMAKQCALIAVNEILNAIPNEIMECWSGETNFIMNDDIEFWHTVKREIEKL